MANEWDNYKPNYGTRVTKKPRPDMWQVGPDPRLHKMKQTYEVMKAQANHRYKHGKNPGQFLLTFDEYVEIWGDKFEQRGRKTGEYQFGRYDDQGDWTKENCYPKLKEHWDPKK